MSMNTGQRFLRLTAVWLAVALAGSSTLAQTTGGSGSPGARAFPSNPSDFGTQTNILQIPAAAFQPTGSGVAYTADPSTGGYISMNNNVTGDLFWAPVTLPAGAEINQLGLYVNDSLNNACNITATLRGYSGTSSPGHTDIVSITTVGFGTGPYYFFSNPITHTVNNDVVSGGGYQYVVVISTTSPPMMDFKAADIRWHRKVSPAPGTATFTDVPTSDFGFQYVEAFNAAGITVGCNSSPPMFCPDRNVTRREMAVFFAKALGLNWPN
jgi:hypothetical protein